MNKEQQDKLWNELSESRRTHLKSMFINDQNGNDEYTNGYLGALIDMFGEHNLNSRPQIKTWEDVEKLNDFYADDINDLHKCDWQNDDKLVSKLIATYKIAKLIDLGYGGMVSEEEWKDGNVEKWSVIYMPFKNQPEIMATSYRKEFVSFHSQELAEEFWSYESNRKLVRQYYMI